MPGSLSSMVRMVRLATGLSTYVGNVTGSGSQSEPPSAVWIDDGDDVLVASRGGCDLLGGQRDGRLVVIVGVSRRRVRRARRRPARRSRRMTLDASGRAAATYSQ